MEISAFVGHSFTPQDKPHVQEFLNYLNKIVDLKIGFSWDHAENAEAKELSEKVIQKMKNKNTFIGICSSRDYTANITHTKLHKFPFQKFFIDVNDMQKRTSDWIIQEIGFACGKNMEIIILLEEGVKLPIGLQGNREYIEFNRDKPELAFAKILETINSIANNEEVTPDEFVFKGSSSVTPTQNEVISDNEIYEITNLTFDDYNKKLFSAIKNGNHDEEEKIYRSYLEAEDKESGDDEVTWKARKLFYRIAFQGTDTLSELISLMHTNDENLKIKEFIAAIYTNFEQYNKAASLYEEVAEKSTNNSSKLENFCDAAFYYIKGRMEENSNNCMDSAKLIFTSVEDGPAKMLWTSYKINREKGEDLLARLYLEGFLHTHPNDNSTRFDLAYSYSENELHDFSIYHYKILTESKPTPSYTWNNLGVAFENLGLKSKKVNAYKKAVDLDEPLAMSNLARNYLNEGFITDARTVIDKAIATDNYNELGYVIKRTKELIENDQKEEDKLLDAVKEPISFFSEFAIASLHNHIQLISGVGEGPESDLQMTFEGDSFRASGSYFEKVKSTMFYGTGSQEEREEKINILYKGNIIGQGVIYQMWKWGESSSEFEATNNSSKANGLLIIEKDKNIIRGYELDKKSRNKFFKIKLPDQKY